MAIKTIVPAGGNFNVAATWSPSGVPVAGDYIVGDALSGNLTLTATPLTTYAGFDFTNYTKTITLGSFILYSGTVGLTASFGTSMSTSVSTGYYSVNTTTPTTTQVRTNGYKIPRFQTTGNGIRNFVDNCYVDYYQANNDASVNTGNNLYISGTFTGNYYGGNNKVVLYGTTASDVIDYIGGYIRNLEVDTLGSVKLSNSQGLQVYSQYGTASFNYIKGGFTGSYAYNGAPNAYFYSVGNNITIDNAPNLFATASFIFSGAGKYVVLNNDIKVGTFLYNVQSGAGISGPGISQSITATTSNVYVYDNYNPSNFVYKYPAETSGIVMAGTGTSSSVKISQSVGQTSMIIDTPGKVNLDVVVLYAKASSASDTYLRYKSGYFWGYGVTNENSPTQSQPFLSILTGNPYSNEKNIFIESGTITFNALNISTNLSTTSNVLTFIDRLRCSGVILLQSQYANESDINIKGAFDTYILERHGYLNGLASNNIFMRSSAPLHIRLESGQIYNITKGLYLDGSLYQLASPSRLDSSTASSPAYINYTGDKQSLGLTNFTDIYNTGLPLYAFDNNNNTLTRSAGFITGNPIMGTGSSSLTFLG